MRIESKVIYSRSSRRGVYKPPYPSSNSKSKLISYESISIYAGALHPLSLLGRLSLYWKESFSRQILFEKPGLSVFLTFLQYGTQIIRLEMRVKVLENAKKKVLGFER